MSHETQIVAHSPGPSSTAVVPVPHVPIAIRVATVDDLPFIDALQKLHTKQVGWMPTKQLEGKIAAGQVLIAEEMQPQSRGDAEANLVLQDTHTDQYVVESRGLAEQSQHSSGASVPRCLRGEPLGYCIGHDQYFKRDDLGIIYQVNVVPGRQRALVGAMLVKAMFERAAWGCRLFCCWCAQDIEANRFWESLGFLPLAFRAGSRGKGRVHIFWQRRIRAGDETTPYWFPSQTSAGAIREDRLVFPIPPGVHWSDAMPIILPSDQVPRIEEKKPKQITGPRTKITHREKTEPKRGVVQLSGVSFTQPAPAASPAAKKPRERAVKPKVKNDPALVAAARELRDRWMERVNEMPLLSQGKYEIARLTDARAAGVLAGPSARSRRECLPQLAA